MCAPDVLTYQWSPATLICNNCPVTKVIVPRDTTFTLTVNENGCINDTVINLFINRNIAINATPDTTLCSHDTVILHSLLTNPPIGQCVHGYTVAPTPYVSITGGGTTIPASAFIDNNGFTYSTDNGTAGPYAVGFNFPFYCGSYAQFYVNSNGWITFQNPYPATTPYQEYTAQTLPPSASDMNPEKVIELLMGDYYLSDGFGGGGGTASYFVSGTTPNRVLVVKFNNMQDISASYTTSGELHLYETSGIIEIMINSSNYSGTNHTTGIKETTGFGTAAPGRNNQPYTISSATHEGWKFTPQFGASVAVQSSFWSPNIALSSDTALSPLAYPATSQTYYVSSTLVLNQYTHPTTCVVRDSVRINVSPFSTSVMLTPGTICPGDTGQLSVNSSNTISSYSWSPISGLSSSNVGNPLVSVIDTTVYYLTAIDNHGCKAVDTFSVNVYSTLRPAIGPGATICYSDSLPLSLQGSSYSNYQWFSIDTTTGSRTPISGANSASFFAHPSSDYVLRVTSLGNVCPLYTNVVRVDSFMRTPIPIDTTGPTSFCLGGNVILQVAQGLTNIHWTPSSYGSQASFPVAASGIFSYTATDQHGCLLYSDTIHVHASPAPNITYNTYRPIICPGDRDTIIATSDQPGTSITWIYSGSTFATGDSIVATASGSYDVVANLNGCMDTSRIVLINIAARPTVALSSDYTLCTCQPDTAITASVSGGTPGYTYHWSDGAMTASTLDTMLGVNSYMVTVTDANGCTASSNTQKIVMSCPRTDISVAPITDTVFLRDTAILTATPQAQGVYTYLWTSATDTSSLSTVLNPTSSTTGVVALSPGTDTVYLHVTDAAGCTYTTQEVINVVQFGAFRMASAFTPNGDQKNQNFYPVFNGPNSPSHVTAFRIYNRWGQLIYDNPNAPGWDGVYGGNQQPLGTYMYFVTIESPNPADASKMIQQSVEGTFQLLR